MDSFGAGKLVRNMKNSSLDLSQGGLVVYGCITSPYSLGCSGLCSLPELMDFIFFWGEEQESGNFPGK